MSEPWDWFFKPSFPITPEDRKRIAAEQAEFENQLKQLHYLFQTPRNEPVWIPDPKAVALVVADIKAHLFDAPDYEI